MPALIFPGSLLCLLLHSGFGTLRSDALEVVPDKLVVLTFDDSVASHHSVVRPILTTVVFVFVFILMAAAARR